MLHMLAFAVPLIPTAVAAQERPLAVTEVLALNTQLEGAIAR